MTITVKVHVNGNYKATVTHKVDSVIKGQLDEVVEVIGTSEKIISFSHGKINSYEIEETYLGEKPSA